MRGFFAGFLVVAAALSFLGSTCDLASDECDIFDPSSSYCTADNVAVSCFRPGEEAHAREQRDPCGADRGCALDKDHRPFCARATYAACPTSQEAARDAGVDWAMQEAVVCNDAGRVIEAKSVCTSTLDGGRVWADKDCAQIYWRSVCSTGDPCAQQARSGS